LCPRHQNKKTSPIAHPAVATADPGVFSGSATVATLTRLQRKRLQRKEKCATQKAADDAATAEKALTSGKVPTGDFSIDVPLPPPTTPPTDMHSLIPSFTTTIQAPSTMELDHNKT